MALDATTTFANPDPDAAPTTWTQVVALLNQLVSSSVPGDYTPYLIGSDVPGSDDQDKVWHRLDGAGRPLGTYVFYNGLWVREAPPIGSRFDFFTGDPTLYFDGTGLGLAGDGPVAKDYFGWALNNGQNGTANLSNQFLIMGAMDNAGITGYSGGLWRTNIEGTPKTQGGSATVTLTDANTYRPERDAVEADTWQADGNTRDAGGGLFGKAASTGDYELVPGDDGNTAPDPIYIIPPYFALAFISYIGYP